MMMTHRILPVVMAAALFAFAPGWASAESEAPSAHHEAPGADTGSHDDSAHKSTHNFTAHWVKTLSGDQKTHVDMMHLELDRELVGLKAQEELVQKQINILATRDNAATSAINTKIDELMGIKKQILRSRYAHILEMRAILTPAQRISYDMETLGFSGVK